MLYVRGNKIGITGGNEIVPPESSIIHQIDNDIKEIKSNQLTADDVQNLINQSLVDGEEVRY